MMLTPFPTHSKRLTFQVIKEDELALVKEIYDANQLLNEITHGLSYTPEHVIVQDYQETQKSGGFSYALVETNSDQIIGYIQFILHNPKDQKPWLGLLLIHPTVHGKGYGKEFIESFVSWLASNQYTSLRLGVLVDNTPAIPFYQKVGFKQVKEIIYDEKPAYIFERSW